MSLIALRKDPLSKRCNAFRVMIIIVVRRIGTVINARHAMTLTAKDRTGTDRNASLSVLQISHSCANLCASHVMTLIKIRHSGMAQRVSLVVPTISANHIRTVQMRQCVPCG